METAPYSEIYENSDPEQSFNNFSSSILLSDRMLTSSHGCITKQTGAEPARRIQKKNAARRKKKISSVSCPSLVSSVSKTSNSKDKSESKDISVPKRELHFRKSKAQTHRLRIRTVSERLSMLCLPRSRYMRLQQPHEYKMKLPLLVSITPENEKSERDRFMRANFNYNPFFVYRCAADERMMEKFNTPSDYHLKKAINIMDSVISEFGSYEEFEDTSGGPVLSRSQILALVKRYLKKEKLESEIKVNLSEDLLSTASMTQKKGWPHLTVRVLNTREYWCDGLLQHEIGTHYLRSCNNRHQLWASPIQREEMMLQHYNPTEEGLASLHSVINRPYPYLWRAALLYYVTYKAAHLSFRDLFADLGKFLKSPSTRWDYCVRAKRGQTDTSVPGTFCKDQVYLEGALQLLKHRHTLDFEMLMRLGKIAHEDVDRLSELSVLDNTRIPSFMMDMKKYICQLDYIAECNGLTDSVLWDMK
ncbi:hypothetical protein C0Q70_19060 [Pomacea canaliculata]|uniref:KIAA0895 n=3 Tax=Pomacea canaliculata TaxID=400727 RepID=A0A2T7NI92_POMCA|nr:hypothetical protein C0Q70_19060 [Pomacea canaliculata]